MTKPYTPITCALHDEYEIAIMHKKCLDIKWLDDNGKTCKSNVRPIDILVKDREEFLVAEAEDGRQLCIRLDKITLLQA